MDVRAIGIAKAFGEEAALRNIDLHVRSGELVALLGPSGSGKTTLLRIIAGLEAADAGRIMFGDEDATTIPVRRRGVGFVFQHYALFRHLNVAANIAFGLKSRPAAHRPNRQAIAARVGELLRLVQLEGLERRFPAALSGGQRQRVALARALAVDPRVLLLDEPFGALDARVRRDLRRSLRAIHDATGQTTIFVTHDQDEALELADRVAILNAGRIEQTGTPDEVHEHPASAFVMSFVGESSRLAAQASAGRVVLRGAALPGFATEERDGPGGLHLRPGDIAFATEGGLPGQVTALHRAVGGRRAEVTLDGPGRETVEVEVAPGAVLARGDAVRVAIRSGRFFPEP